jgi:helix-turn-helix domain of resolvase
MTEKTYTMPELEKIALDIENQEEKLAEQKQLRNTIMKTLAKNGESKSKIARSGKISRQALYKIIEN